MLNHQLLFWENVPKNSINIHFTTNNSVFTCVDSPYQHHHISSLSWSKRTSVSYTNLGELVFENNLSHSDVLWMCSEVCYHVLADKTNYFLHSSPPTPLLPTPPPPPKVHISQKPNKTMLCSGILLHFLCAWARLHIRLVLYIPLYASIEISLSLCGCSSRRRN